MRRTLRPLRFVIELASAEMVGLLAGSGAHASPITGDGLPIDTEQPSLGLTYLVRTGAAANIADLGQVVLFAGNFAPGGYSVANGQLLSIAATILGVFSPFSNSFLPSFKISSETLPRSIYNWPPVEFPTLACPAGRLELVLANGLIIQNCNTSILAVSKSVC